MTDIRKFEDLSYLEKTIVTDTNCDYGDAWKVERVMRDDIVRAPLDALSRPQFRRMAREAFELLNAEREMFENYFVQTRRAYEEMKAANEHRVLDIKMETHA